MQAEPKAAAGSRVPAALRFADFRVVWLSAIASGMAFAAERVVIGWLLIDRTDSSFLVGIGVGVSMIPNLLLGVPSGVLADRFDRRSLVRWSSTGAALNACLMGALGLAGILAIWQVLLLSFLGGCLRTLSGPARQTYAFDVVGAAHVVNGMAMLNLGQRLGGIIGSLGAGAILAASGEGAAFMAIAASHVLAAAIMLFARSRGQSAPAVSHLQPVWTGLGEYFGEMKRNRTLAMLVLLTASVEVLGFSYQALLPSIARDRLDIGAGGLGFLNAMAAVGGLASVLFVSLRGNVEHKGIAFLVVLQVFGVLMVLLGNSNHLIMAVSATALVASLAALSDLFTQSLVQSAVSNELRGRAMGSWSLAIGLGPLGSIQIGALAAAVGVTLALTANGVVLLGLGVAALVFSRRLREL